jgi:beta-mannanase
VLLGVVLWLRSLRWLRPHNAKAVSWELALFQLVRWPWVLIGCLHAIAGRLAGREFQFKVTPKGGSGARPLPLKVVVPYLVIGAVCAAPALLRLDAGAAHGYYTLALINVALYLTAAVAIIVLHVLDHPGEVRPQVARLVAGKLSATLAAVLVLVGAMSVPAPWARGPAPPPPVRQVGSPRLALGVTTPALAANSTRAWTAAELGEVNAFEQAVHAPAGVVLWYADWAKAKIDLGQLQAVYRRGATPEITWEPWDYRVGLRHAQPGYTLAGIAAGRHDAYIRSVARTLEAYGHPVLLRFAQEMNGDWYPWGVGVNGNRPGDFIAAWRHVHDVFAAVGAHNVRWVWSPVARYGTALSTAQYPGDAYVDEIGLSGFNGGSALHWTGWRSFASLFDASLAAVHVLAPGKPVQISEVGSAEAGGSKAAWIAAMFSDLARHPAVRTVIWFDVAKQTDWRITSSSAAARAFSAGLRRAQSPTRPGARGSAA